MRLHRLIQAHVGGRHEPARLIGPDRCVSAWKKSADAGSFYGADWHVHEPFDDVWVNRLSGQVLKI